MSSPIPAPRIVTTTHTESGIATIGSDVPSVLFAPFGPNTSNFSVHHTSPTVPINVTGPAVPPATPTTMGPGAVPRCPPTGTMFCTVDFAPATSSPMHRTVSIDYAVVLSGEIVLIMEDEKEVVLRAGDICVQRATMHKWENRTDEWTRMMCVLVGTETVKLADGTELGNAVTVLPPKAQ